MNDSFTNQNPVVGRFNWMTQWRVAVNNFFFIFSSQNYWHQVALNAVHELCGPLLKYLYGSFVSFLKLESSIPHSPHNTGTTITIYFHYFLYHFQIFGVTYNSWQCEVLWIAFVAHDIALRWTSCCIGEYIFFKWIKKYKKGCQDKLWCLGKPSLKVKKLL